MNEDNDTTRLIEERIRDHHVSRITASKPDCDYHISPQDFEEMAKRLNVKIEHGGGSEREARVFATLHLVSGQTRVYADAEIGRGAFEPCALIEPRAKPIDWSTIKKDRESRPFVFSEPRVVEQLGEQLLKCALKELTDQRDYDAAVKLVGAYELLQRSRPFGIPAGLESGAAIRDE